MLELLKQAEIEEITVTDICNHSDIVRRTFYAHFNDKYDLIEHIMDDYILEFIEICNFKENVDFKEGTTKWFQYLYDNKQVFNVLLKSSISPLFNRKIEEIIKKEIDMKLNIQWLNKEGLKRDTLLKFLTAAVLGVMVDFTLGKDNNYEDKANELLILFEPYF